MEKNYFNIAVVFTLRCSVKCPHCGFSCSPQGGQDVNVDMVKRFCMETYEYARANSRCLGVNLTGGEPFVRYSELLELAEWLNRVDQGIMLSCVTNGYWASSVSRAKDLLGPLRRAGCMNIGISIDDYHLQEVGLGRVRNAVKALIELDMSVGFKFSQMNNMRSLFECLKEVGDPFLEKSDFRFVVHSFNCLPVGRARGLSKEHFRYLPLSSLGNCALGRFTLIPDGRLLVCCGSFDFAPTLVLGEYPRETVEGLIAAFNKNDLFNLLRARGPAYFAPFLDDAGYTVSTKSYTHICDLCHCVFRDVSIDLRKAMIIAQATEDWKHGEVNNTKVISLLESFMGVEENA